MNESIKKRAEAVFASHGLSLEEGIDAYLEAVAKTGRVVSQKESADVLDLSYITEALSSNYEFIYYVDIATNHFVRFSPQKGGHLLETSEEGDDFFSYSESRFRLFCHPHDLSYMLRVVDKEILLRELETSPRVSATYRSVSSGSPVYFSMRIVKSEDGTHLIAGFVKIDDQMRKEKELRSAVAAAKAQAKTDSLTGLGNSLAYAKAKAKLRKKIKEGKAEFALVLCDINNLKQTNDVYGHTAGDALIRDAAARMETIFAPAPVFRVGGDEFVIIVQGRLYHNRGILYSALLDASIKSIGTRAPVIAIGMSEWNPETDRRITDVFVRADFAMYENKRWLKGLKD